MRQRRGPELACVTADGRRIYRIRGMAGAFAHLVAARGGSLLVDAGFADDAPLLVDACRAALASDEPLATILLTHYHMDHAAGAAAVREATGAPILISETDARVFAREVPYVRLPANLTPAMVTFMDNSDLWRRFMRSAEDWFPRVDGTVAGGETLAGFRLLPAPGHTDGALALYDEAERILVSADYLVYPREAMPVFFKSFLRTINLDPERARETTRELLRLPFERLFPSHGEYLLENARETALASDLYREFAAPRADAPPEAAFVAPVAGERAPS